MQILYDNSSAWSIWLIVHEFCARWLPGIMRIVEQRSYFVLHAARQSGKTTRDEVVDGKSIHFIGL